MIMGNPKKIASMIIAKRQGSVGEDRAAQLRDESMEALAGMNKEEDESTLALKDAAMKLISGLEGKSPEIVAKAFHTMFKLVEMMPHEEYGEVIEEIGEEMEG